MLTGLVCAGRQKVITWRSLPLCETVNLDFQLTEVDVPRILVTHISGVSVRAVAEEIH